MGSGPIYRLLIIMQSKHFTKKNVNKNKIGQNVQDSQQFPFNTINNIYL